MASQATKLRIEVYKDPEFKQQVDVLVADFNPSDYSLTYENDYKARETIGTSKPELAFASGRSDQLSLAFLFDGTGVNPTATDPRAGSVQGRVDRLLSLLEYRGTEHEPPYVKVLWGNLVFRGVMKRASVKFELFDREGSPLRAKVDASFEEVVSGRERIATEASSSPDVDRVWRVQSGDRIDRIAQESYGHVAYWRQIARANRLVNPRALVAGSVLSLPRLERS